MITKMDTYPKKHYYWTKVEYLGGWTIGPMVWPGFRLTSLRAVKHCKATTLPAGWKATFCTVSFHHYCLSETSNDRHTKCKQPGHHYFSLANKKKLFFGTNVPTRISISCHDSQARLMWHKDHTEHQTKMMPTTAKLASTVSSLVLSTCFPQSNSSMLQNYQITPPEFRYYVTSHQLPNKCTITLKQLTQRRPPPSWLSDLQESWWIQGTSW